MSALPEAVREQIAGFRGLREVGRKELNLRRITHRRHDALLADMSDLELNQACEWYDRKIDALLAPYEREE